MILANPATESTKLFSPRRHSGALKLFISIGLHYLECHVNDTITGFYCAMRNIFKHKLTVCLAGEKACLTTF
jgi:hypothetical protein